MKNDFIYYLIKIIIVLIIYYSFYYYYYYVYIKNKKHINILKNNSSNVDNFNIFASSKQGAPIINENLDKDIQPQNWQAIYDELEQHSLDILENQKKERSD